MSTEENRALSFQQYNDDLMRQATEAFARHQLREQGDGRWVLQRREDNGKWSSMWITEVVVLGFGRLLVHGDIEAVMYVGCASTEPAEVVAWIAGSHLQYAAGKASLALGDARTYTRDEEVARYELQQQLQEALEATVEEVRAWLAEEFNDEEGDAAELEAAQRDVAPRIAAWLMRRESERGPTEELSRGQPEWLRELLASSLPSSQSGFECTSVHAHDVRGARHRALRELNETGSVAMAMEVLAKATHSSPGQQHWALFDSESYGGLGRVYDPRMFFAHAAIQRLSVLLREAAKAVATTDVARAPGPEA